MAHYRVTPLEKKSIHIVYEMFRENPDGTISWFNIEDHYRWGQGFVEEDMDINLETDQTRSQYCKADAGEYESCDLDDRIAVYFEFSDDISEEEQEEIKNNYLDGDEDGVGGAGWLYDAEHDWQEEDCYVVVDAPYRVDLCTEDGTVIEENVKPKEQPVVGKDNPTAWPFPVKE